MTIQYAYDAAFAPTSGVSFSGFTVDATTPPPAVFGFANAIFIDTAVTSLTMTLVSGATVMFSNLPMGKLIPIRCTMVTWTGGTVLAFV